MRLKDIVVKLSVCKQEHIKNVRNPRQSLDVRYWKIQVAEFIFLIDSDFYRSVTLSEQIN
jgi:hypothetical protein